MDDFNFALGDVVLAEWEDKLFYAKIDRIDWSQSKCVLIFDDDSVEECPFTKIHSVTETTAEIVCIICKDGRSSRPNEIVLCDKCGIGYHQRCHQPNIPASALEFDAPWMCVYCSVGALCPYLENPFDSKTKKTVSRKRRLTSSVKSDGFASSGNSTEEEGSLTSVGHRQGMSRFYLTSHREGPKPRGRPSFNHKVKMVGERRGRGSSSGRTLGGSAIRENFEPHSEREYCFDSEERKMPSQHFQRQSEELSRNQRRGNYPAKRVAKIEDYSSATARKAHDSSERNLLHMETDLSGKLARSRPRDAPREKQRLTQDLARQKRLLSEDIARAELLQREQILKKVADTYGDSSEVACADERPTCDSVLSEISVSGSAESQSRECSLDDGQDKCPSPFKNCSEKHLSKHEQNLLKDDLTQPAGHTSNKKEGESLFDKCSHKGDIKIVDFVNSDNVEVEGMDTSLLNCEIKTLNSSSDSSEKEQGARGEDLAMGSLEPLQFENVTDDELAVSDVEPQSPVVSGSDKTSVEVDLGLCTSKEDSEVESKRAILPEMCPDIGTSVADSADCTEISRPEKNIFDSFSLKPCDCQSKFELEEQVTTESGCRESQNAPGSPGVGNSEEHPDHSIIKLDQVMTEPDIQCQHSSKHEFISEQVIVSSVDFECSGPMAEEMSDCRKREELAAVNHSPEVESAKRDSLKNGVPSEWPNSEEDRDNEAAPAILNKHHSSPVNGDDASLSNNEGMSDAGEMSDPEIAARVARGKVKTKKRKKSRSVAKLQIRCGVGNPRPKVNRSRRVKIVKGHKRNKLKGLESDSDENEAYVTTADCTSREKAVSKVGEGEGAVPSTTCRPMEGNMKIAREEQMEGDALTDASAEVSEKVGKDGVSSSVVDNSEEEVEVQGLGELGKKERMKKEKRLAVKQKRKSEEKDKERATPPHLVSQNRYARDLPRHNWLVEQLLQQNKLCGDTINNLAIPDKKDTQEKLSETEEADGKKTEKSERKSSEVEVSSKSDTVSSSGEQNEAQISPISPTKENVHSELHKNVFKRCLQPSVPRAPPKLKPSTEMCFDGKSAVLKHKLSPRETPILEPLPKLKKIVDEDQSPKQEVNMETEDVPKEALSAGLKDRLEMEEPKRKALSPIEILDDDEDKNKCALEPSAELKLHSPSVKTAQDENEEEASGNSSLPESSRSNSFSPPRKRAALSLAKRRGSSVSPEDHLGRPLHMSPHRAAILIPVVPMQDGMHPRLTNSSPRLKGYPPRTFTPHLLTHTSPLSAASVFPDALPPGVRYPGNACMHQHLNPKAGGPCKRDINCPFHGNQGRGITPSPLSIPGHLSVSAFGQHGHEHLTSSSLGRNLHEGSKSPCTHPECKTCQPDKDANIARDATLFNDKGPSEVPKVVKPIAHVPGKHAPLIFPHLSQRGRLSHTPYRGLEELYEEKARRIGGDPSSFPPQKVPKSADKLTTDHSGPGISPLHVRPRPLTLSELNRRREEEYTKAHGEESRLGLKSKVSPHGDFNTATMPSPSRTAHIRSHSKDGLALSPGHQGSIVVSQPDQKNSPHPLGRGIGEEKERLDYSSYMAELLKSGPPRLRTLEDPHEIADFKLLVDRQKHEGMLVVNSDKPKFVQPVSVKDSSELFADGKRTTRSFEKWDKSMRHLPEDGHSPSLRLLGSRGGAGILDVGPRDSENSRTKEFEERPQRPNSQEMDRERQRNDTAAVTRGFGRRGFELVRTKDQTKRADLRGLTAERERARELAVSIAQSGSDKSARPHVDARARPLLPPRVSQRFDSRLDPRMVALRDMEMHRRLDNNRLSEVSHRDMLSRMALSFASDKSKVAEQGLHDAPRIRPDFRCRVSSNSATGDYTMPASSRQALDRLAAAAGKAGSLTAESRLKQEMERQRERQHHHMSVEHYDANRRLLHAELKDKVNPLVFSKEPAIRVERERELEEMRLREKLKMEHDKLIAADNFTEDRKRKRPHEGDLSFVMGSQETSAPGYSRSSLDREEYERLKRMRLLPTTATAGLVPGYHRCASNRPLHVEIKENGEHIAKPRPINLSQRRLEADSEKLRMRLARSRDLEQESKNDNALIAERGAMWLRERERVLRAQEELSRSTAALHGGACVSRSFLIQKHSAMLSSGDESRKSEEESVNRCCVCKRDASFLCSGCQAAWYCSSGCQLSAWTSHSRECGQTRKR